MFVSYLFWLLSLLMVYFVCLSMWTSFKANTSSGGGGGLSSSESSTNLILAIMTLLFTLAFSIFSYRFLRKNFGSLPRADFKMKYDSLYQNLDYHSLSALPNTFWFLQRRMVFSALIVFGTCSIVLQIFLADVLSTLLLAFFLRVKPMANWLNNAIQIFNELVVLVSVWLMFHFTEFVAQPETRYDLAFYFLYFVAVDIALNLIILVFTILRKIYVAVKRIVIRRKAAKMKNLKVDK